MVVAPGPMTFASQSQGRHAHLPAIKIVPHDARLKLGQGLRRDNFVVKVQVPRTRDVRCWPPTLLTLRSGSSIRSGQDRITATAAFWLLTIPILGTWDRTQSLALNIARPLALIWYQRQLSVY
jgi:hypothetical protein